jgi:hypothetical protein
VRHFSRLVGCSTIVVAIGVLLEGIELVHAAIEWRKLKRRENVERVHSEELRQIIPIGSDTRKLPKSHSGEPPWARLILRVGLILVVIGVVGEWRYGADLEDAHDAVHTCDLDKIKEANEKAADAANSATVAREEADAAKIAAKDAQEYARWRSISDKQVASIRKRVASLNGHILIIQANPDEPEILAFANRIVLGLGNGIMDVKPTFWPRGWIVPAGLRFDIGKARQADFDTIVRALDKAGVVKADVLRRASDHRNVTDDQLVLTVGPRH